MYACYVYVFMCVLVYEGSNIPPYDVILLQLQLGFVALAELWRILVHGRYSYAFNGINSDWGIQTLRSLLFFLK